MNVPKLRFKEFDGEFQYEKTARFFKHIRNGFVGTATPYYTDSSGIKYLQSNNIKDGQINEKNIVYINKEFHKKHEKNTLKMGDLLVVQSGHAGDCAVVNEKYINCNCHALIIMTPNSQDEISTDFLNVYMHTTKGKKELNKLITGNTIKHILASDMKKFNFPNLQIEEQKKIAGFFKILNKKIQLQQQKIDLLQEQKKGYMQKIFNQEIRFKDGGHYYMKWAEYILNDLGETYTGLSGKTKEDFGVGEHSFVTYVNVFKNLFAKKFGVEKVIFKENENQNYVKTDDLFFTTSSETPKEVGMASIWKHESCNLHLNSFCFGYRVTNPKILPDFLAISLRSEYMRKKITILAQGSTRYNISKTELMKEKVNVPCLEEQKRIVEFYLKLDTSIELEKKKLDILKEQKQGFMQQMFI